MTISKIQGIMNSRPGVYGMLGFQQFFLWTFLIAGILAFIHTIYLVVSGLTKYIMLDAASDKIASRFQVSQEEVHAILMKYVQPFHFQIIFYSFFSMVCLFIMARYSQKVINRNRYILQLEKEIKNQPS